MIAPGDVVSLTIEKPAAGGRMIARADRLIVLVSGTIPGERVRARVERVAKGVAYAAAEQIEDPSADRRDAGIDPRCGGCAYAHIAYSRQLELKAQVISDAFSRIGRIALPGAVPVMPSPEEGYRLRARLHARGGALGFFREGTHELCDVRRTRQLLPETVDVMDRLAAALRQHGAAVRELVLAENSGASHRVVHLETSPGSPSIDPGTLDQLAAIDGLTGLSSPSGVRGDVHVVDSVTPEGHASISLRRHVLAFFQGNRYLLNDLVSHVIGFVPAGSPVVDLYAGVGLFAIAAAATRDASVTAVEGDRAAASDLAANAVSAGGAVLPVRQSVEEWLTTVKSAGDRMLIIDPPRTGVSRDAMVRIRRLAARRIVYVSCDAATLARDARTLVDAGYAVGRTGAFDLFPNTPHVETVAVFERT
jgi:23S rRNA (uracil1939-C5)-methyltransferase